jgi:membrane protein DedA with SNARE-associated domain
MIEQLVNVFVHIIGSLGYFGVFFLMTLESMIFPVPSEAVMPFAGFLIAEAKMSFIWVIIVSTLGSIVGSLISYAIGFYGGKPFVQKFGKWFLLNEHHLDITEKYFKEKGEITIFISRFIPVIRHLISIPAGIGRMNLLRFSLFTIIGAGLWNVFLVYVGIVLRNNWQEILKYSRIIDIIIVAVLLVGVCFYIFKLIKSRRERYY